MLALLGRYIGLSAIVCVLLLFFFPLAHGSFQATHGPTTAFRARRACLAVLLLICAALKTLSSLVPASLRDVVLAASCAPDVFKVSAPPTSDGILRC